MNRFLLPFLLLLSFVWQCRNKDGSAESKPEDYTGIVQNELVAGEALAKKYCATCHLFPSPELLDKTTWKEQVLPNMGARMGLRSDNYDPFEGVDTAEKNTLKRLNVYPDTAIINEAEWLSIRSYYQKWAPEVLPNQNNKTRNASSPPPFHAESIKFGQKEVPQVTLLKYEANQKTLFIGDHIQLYAFDRDLKTVGSWQMQSPSSDMAVTKDGIMVLSIGQFDPSEKREGVFFPLTLTNGGVVENYVIPALQRPVQFSIGDLNGDNQDDVVICSFGNHQGQLAWYDHFNSTKENVLTSLPGSRKTEIIDLDKDGRNDIVALLTQAWEKLVVFYNDDNGQFKEVTLIEFPAVHGSSYFEFKDFNQDGHPDVLLTNGDNWDYSNVPKPYHGIRIYLNDGLNQFTEAYFYPLYGCNEARAVDFDNDGDLDIAAIAFYSEQPTEGFVYLENNGQMNFTAHYMNETANGKWLTMDTGDFNQDGYQDIFLGSYFHNASELVKLMSAGVETFPEVLLLTYNR